MIISIIKKALQRQFLNQFLKVAPRLSDKTILKLVTFAEKMTPKSHSDIVVEIKKMVEKDTPGARFIKRIIKNVSPNCRKKILYNLIFTGFLDNQKKRNAAKERGEAIPTTLLISPTMRCNLKCVGCYAGKYSQKDDLPVGVLDRVIQEAKEMGTAFFSMLGGEPFIYKDLLKVLGKHNDCYFQVYTNSTLINEELVKKIEKLGNILPILSIEGFEKETDARRGKGVYKKVMKAMDLLRTHGVPFGYSCTVTKHNADLIMTDKFVDMLLKKGAYVGWYFLCMPVGSNPDLSLMPTPEQRLKLIEQGRYLRKTRPFFFVDFWNDAPFVGGCIAGKHYCHITSKGDVEPCIFTHFAMDNVKEKSLKECMNSEYFKALRKKQPYTDNLFLPCMWIDNPEFSRKFHSELKVYPTHPGADDVLKKTNIKKDIDRYSEEVHKIYEKPWQDWCNCKQKAKVIE